MEAAPHPWPALGVLLLRDGLVTKEALEDVLSAQQDSRQQRVSGWRLGEILIECGMITAADVARLVAEQYELPYLELDPDEVDSRIAGLLPDDLVERFCALPISRHPDGSLVLAVSDPATVLFSDELRRAVGVPLRFAVVAPASMRAAIASTRVARRSAPPLVVEERPGENAPILELLLPSISADEAPPASDDSSTSTRQAAKWPPIGALLVREGLVTADELDSALAQQRLSTNRRLGEILVERRIVTPIDVARAVADQYELPFVDFVESEVDWAVANLLPRDLADRYTALPLRFLPDGTLLVAIADPTSVLNPEEILAALGARLSFAVADPAALARAIARWDTVLHQSIALGDPVEATDPAAHAHDESSVVGLPVDGGAHADVGASADEAAPSASHEIDEAAEAHLEVVDVQTTDRPGDARAVPDLDTESPVAEPELEAIREVEAAEGESKADSLLEEADTAAGVVELPEDEVVAELATPAGIEESVSLTAVINSPQSIEEVVSPDTTSDAAETDAPGADLQLTEIVAIVEEDDARAETETTEHLAGMYQTFESDDVVGPAKVDALTGFEAVEDEAVEDERDDAPVADTGEPEDAGLFGIAAGAESGMTDGAQWMPLLVPDTEPDDISDPAETEGFEAIDDTSEVDEPVGDADTTDDSDVELAEIAAMVEVETAAGFTEPAAPEPTESATLDLVHELVARAAALGATSVHFSPQEHGIVVRARVDGVLRELAADTAQSATLARELERLDSLDAEHGLAVATLATQHGTAAVVHVSRDEVDVRGLDDIVSSPESLATLREALRLPSGLVLVAGPSGSGRTTTLYSALTELRSPDLAIVTIEDPVERVLPGVDQVSLDPHVFPTFADAMRRVLDADPDVVVVGEGPDAETLGLALHAATSRLVLAVVTARSAAAAIAHLTATGIAPELVASTLTTVVAQRLARAICPSCREGYYPDAEELEALGRPADEAGRRLLARGRGCPACGGTGFSMRVALHEVLTVTGTVQALVATGAPASEIERAAVGSGMHTLRDDGVRLCLEGVTSLAEIDRVV